MSPVCIVSVAQFSVKLTLSSQTYHEGHNMTAVCEVTTDYRRYIVYWVKRSPYGDGNKNKTEVDIATNAYVNQDFRQTGRFKAGIHPINETLKVNFKLNISGRF